MSLKTITITAYNRPHYFEQLLLSLTQNNLSGWKIYIQIEPSDLAQQFIDIAERILLGQEYSIEINKSVLGVRGNPYSLLKKVFDSGSEVNVYLEEDILISPDVICLADWYMTLNHVNTMCMNLMLAGCSSTGFVSNPAFPSILVETKCFNSLGFIISRDQWENYFLPNWFRFPEFFANIYGDQVDGWDLAMYDYLLSHRNLKVLSPLLARANHIGQYGGAHCSEAFHNMAFGNLPIYQGKTPSLNYVVNKNIDELPYSVKAHLNLWQEMTESLITLKRVVAPLRKFQRKIIGWRVIKKVLVLINVIKIPKRVEE